MQTSPPPPADFETALNLARTGVVLTRARHIVYANRCAETLLGWPPKALLEQALSVCWPDAASFAAFELEHAATLERGQPIEVERQLKRHDGTLRWFSLRVDATRVPQAAPEAAPQPQHDAPAEAGLGVWTLDDITDRRLTHEALAQTKERAEQANLAKSDFLANASHEVRTPLNGLLGLVRLAQEPEVGHVRLREYLDRIEDTALALAGVISDILDLSQIEAGQISPRQVPFELHELMGTAHGAFSELAKAKGLECRLEIGKGVPQWVSGDPVRVRQILANFISNALKNTAQGRIELAVQRRPDARIRVLVRDTGSGIPVDVKPRLFQPFSRGEAGGSRRLGRTGLGLSICRQLAVLMGGGVGVQSKLGEGSMFWADLPLRRVPAPPIHGANRNSDADALRGARLLLVEDDAVNTLVTEATLRRWGAEVTLAANGEQAIEAVDKSLGRFDAVLMDLHMPVMGGIAATIEVRKRYPAAKLPIIALSADVLVSERDRALHHGMNEFVSKPIDLERLSGVLAYWVQRARAAQS
jgi:PAS domain S-box-containing protein